MTAIVDIAHIQTHCVFRRLCKWLSGLPTSVGLQPDAITAVKIIANNQVKALVIIQIYACQRQCICLLRETLASPRWQEVIAAGAVEAARRRVLTPPRTANVFSLPVDQLRAINGPRVREMIAAGERDAEVLLDALGTWPEQWPEGVPVRLSFLGVNLTLECDMSPRCVYCNQRPVKQRMAAEDWKALVRDAASQEGEGPYLYLTGGEPLLLGEALWGEDGLIRAATEAGAACNLNSNRHL